MFLFDDRLELITVDGVEGRRVVIGLVAIVWRLCLVGPVLFVLIVGFDVGLDDLEVMLLQCFPRSFVYEPDAGLSMIVVTFPSSVAERPCGVSNEGAMVVGGCVGHLLFSDAGLALRWWRFDGSRRFEIVGVKSGVIDRFVVGAQNFSGVRVDRGFLGLIQLFEKLAVSIGSGVSKVIWVQLRRDDRRVLGAGRGDVEVFEQG